MSAADHSAKNALAGTPKSTATGYNGRYAALAAPLTVPETMNLPNALTLARIVLVPLLVVVLLTKFEGHMILGVPKSYVAAGIFGIASLTDFLDGYLARR